MNSRRKIGFFIISALILFSTGCGGSGVDTAATDIAAVAQTVAVPTTTATAEPTPTPTSTPIPTDTLTPTITPTATNTATPTPTPTPVGGGNGMITFLTNPGWEKEPDDLNGIWSVRSDGSEITQVLSRAEAEELLGDAYNPRGFGYFENNGRRYLYTGSALHVVDEDWQIVRSIDTQDMMYSVDFSPDGSQILFVAPGGQLHFIPVEEGETVVLPVGADVFPKYIRFSADGSSVYYTRGQGREEWIMNVDGSDRRLLTLEALNAYSPHAGKPLGIGIISVRRSPHMDAFAVSPDRSMAAFTWGDLLFVADGDDPELIAPRLVGRLPQRSDAELAESAMWYYYAETIHWSPDMQHVGVTIRDCIQEATGEQLEVCGVSIAVVRVADGVLVSQLPVDEGYHNFCGFSPDSSRLAVVIDDYKPGSAEEGIYLVDFTTDTWTRVVDLTEILPSEEQSIDCYGFYWGEADK